MKLSVVSRTGATQVTDEKYEVTGTLSPDVTGDYLPDGIYNGKMSYSHAVGVFFIWWNGIATWYISGIKGGMPGPHWCRTAPTIEGQYGPLGGATGIATVTEI